MKREESYAPLAAKREPQLSSGVGEGVGGGEGAGVIGGEGEETGAEGVGDAAAAGPGAGTPLQPGLQITRAAKIPAAATPTAILLVRDNAITTRNKRRFINVNHSFYKASWSFSIVDDDVIPG